MKFVKKALSFVTHHKILSSITFVVILILTLILRPKPAVPIATQTITYTDLTQKVSVSGTVGAKSVAKLTFPISGTISWIGPKEGDTVITGDAIAELDQRTVLKNLQQSLLDYSKQRNTFDQTIADNGNTQNPESAVTDAEKRILQNNQYDLDKAVNSVELQDLARQQSILTTPISGILASADVSTVGTTAVVGTTSFTVIDPNSVVFNMDVDEADVGKVVPGQSVSLTLDAYPDTTLMLPVDSIDFVSHTTSNGGNAYTVDVKLPSNSSDKYRIGMNGSADITTAQRTHVLSVPLASLVNNNEVYVKKNNKFVLTQVTLGLQTDTDAQVLQGLSQGDVIALDPTQVTKK